MNVLKQLTQTIGLYFFVSASIAATPLYSIQLQTKAPAGLREGKSAVAIYKVCNKTKVSHALTWVPIQGVSIETTANDACVPPFTLGSEKCCQLYLKLNGSQIAKHISAGPRICSSYSPSNKKPDLGACSDPNSSQVLNLQRLSQQENTTPWIKGLSAQSPPPANLQKYVDNIHTLAPGLEIIQLRFPAGATNYSFYAELITHLRAIFGKALMINMVPDNSATSYGPWNCIFPHWECVLGKSIHAMNEVNALLTPGLGFNGFSLEQSYVEPQTAEGYENMQACFRPSTSTGTCPAQTKASTNVEFGNVLPSFGGSDIYGPNKLNFAFIQMYNLGKKITEEYRGLISPAPDSFFPPDSAANCLGGAPFPVWVVDIDSPDAYPLPKIPCTHQATHTYNVYTGADTKLVSAYLTYLFTQYPLLAVAIETSGSPTYMSLSGESDMLGGKAWTLDKLQALHAQMMLDFARLKVEYPSLFASGVSPDSLKFAIWNFEDILKNNFPE